MAPVAYELTHFLFWLPNTLGQLTRKINEEEEQIFLLF